MLTVVGGWPVSHALVAFSRRVKMSSDTFVAAMGGAGTVAGVAGVVTGTGDVDGAGYGLVTDVVVAVANCAVAASAGLVGFTFVLATAAAEPAETGASAVAAAATG